MIIFAAIFFILGIANLLAGAIGENQYLSFVNFGAGIIMLAYFSRAVEYYCRDRADMIDQGILDGNR